LKVSESSPSSISTVRWLFQPIIHPIFFELCGIDVNTVREERVELLAKVPPLESGDPCHIHIFALLIQTSGPQIRSDPILRSDQIRYSDPFPFPFWFYLHFWSIYNKLSNSFPVHITLTWPFSIQYSYASASRLFSCSVHYWSVLPFHFRLHSSMIRDTWP
jgi:hypothetical protein